MSTSVIAPMSGAVVPLADVPDPVFAAQMVGSGLALQPSGARDVALAPITGTLVKVMPHAFVVAGPDGGVLVHLGIDTVKLDGGGFDVLVEEGDPVEVGTPVVRWTPSDVAAKGLSELVLVCALDTPAGLVDSTTVTPHVEAGAGLFTLPLGGSGDPA